MANEKFKIHEAALEILRENTLMTMAEAMELAKKDVQLQKLDREALIAELNANTQ